MPQHNRILLKKFQYEEEGYISSMTTKTGEFCVILFGVTALALLIQCTKFDQNLFGVIFDPNVKGEFIAGIPHYNYTLENLRTMMEVVSTKFTRIINIIFPNVEYDGNKIYNNTDDIIARIGQAAALLNLERKTKSLAVIIGLHNLPEDRTQFQPAVEAAKVANSIYPGTVEGIWLLGYLEDINTTLVSVENLRSLTTGMGLKVGTTVSLTSWKLLAQTSVFDFNNISLFQKQILNSDFVVIGDQSFDGREIYAYNNLSSLSWQIIKFPNEVKKIGNKIEVIRLAFWYAPQGFSNSTTKRFEDYWISANKFAIEEEIHVWMAFAFTIPTSARHLTGWWRLSINELINNVSGYVENVSGKRVGEEHFDVARSHEGPIQSSKPPEEKNSDVVVGSSVAGGFALLVFLNVVIYFVRQRRRNTNTRSTTLTAEEIDAFFGNRNIYDPFQEDVNLRNVPELSLPYNADLEIAKENLEILWDQILGGGQFGLVCKAILKNMDNREIALKMAKEASSPTTMKGLLSEIKILSYLGEHSNIVSITGAYTAELDKGIVYLAMELCPLGSLRNHLRTLKNPDVSESLPKNTYYNFHEAGIPLLDLMRWCQEIACGMEYLEEKNVVHADLATRNVLLTAEKTAKVTDFGLSRRLYEYGNYAKRSQEPLPWRWLALESLKNLEFSVKSDVWGYGVTIWEIFSFGDQPFPGYTWSLDFIEGLENGLRMRRPRAAPNDVFEIMTRCWNLIPEERPSFADLSSQMKILSESTKKAAMFENLYYEY